MTQKFRLEVMKSSINGYEKIVEDDNTGTKTLYKQGGEWKEMNNWKLKKINKKENWWKGKAVIQGSQVSIQTHCVKNMDPIQTQFTSKFRPFTDPLAIFSELD